MFLPCLEAFATTPDLLDTLVSLGRYDTFVELVEEADLELELKEQGPFTVFIPSDDAFKEIPASDLAALKLDKKRLTEVLRYHMIPREMPTSLLRDEKSVSTIDGAMLDISAGSTYPLVNDAQVVRADRRARNGIIHEIDAVLVPPNE